MLSDTGDLGRVEQFTSNKTVGVKFLLFEFLFPLNWSNYYVGFFSSAQMFSIYQHRNEKYLLSFSLNMFNLAHFLYKVLFSIKSFPLWGNDFYSGFSFSSLRESNSLWPHEPQHARPPRPLPTSRVHPNPCALSWWCHPTISSSVVPFLPAFKLSQHQGLFQWVNSSHQVAKILEFQVQHQSFQWTPRTDLL